MAVTPTYPGVYVEELPSAVRTIVGVQTAITAFVGYTKRGPADEPTPLRGFGDYERAFGRLDPDCPVGYAVQQFFQNGGGEAWVVRVAEGDAKAKIELAVAAAGGQTALVLEAMSPGIWANQLRVTVDYDTINPDSLFNLTVTSFDGTTPGDEEVHRNLSMNSAAPTFAVDSINANSRLVTAEVPAGLNIVGNGFSTSAEKTRGTVLDELGTDPHTVLLSVDGGEPFEASFTVPAAGSVVAKYESVAEQIAAAAGARGISLAPSVAAKHMTFTSETSDPEERRSVHFSSAPGDNAAAVIGLGVANGGTEIDAAGNFRPAETGARGNPIGDLPEPSTTAHPISVDLHTHATLGSAAVGSAELGIALPPDRPATREDARAALEEALRAAARDPANEVLAEALSRARVRLYGGRLHLTPGSGPDAMLRFTAAGGDDVIARLGLEYVEGENNLAFYTPALGEALRGQGQTVLGSDGQAPSSDNPFTGTEAEKSGIHALDDVDLVNILCIPGRSSNAVMNAAVSWCERHRCFYIADIPEGIRTPDGAADWLRDPSQHPVSNHAATYFPRIVAEDPMQEYRPRAMSPCGAIAGLYARTDQTRGVWKAPAGTDARLRGVLGGDYPLTDAENGAINPLGVNAIRSLPVYGNVAWGARTLEGSDQVASQWKYVPVRRTALFIEESLYRGTQWAVFEPNDEPLWMQIRLNVGAFMHSLFLQHAFQGSSPRDAYLVKCDSETTTQDDIDKGIVNVVVGFAPLKPAEFIFLKITQLAGQGEG
jgi:phage tail sheath protein FI